MKRRGFTLIELIVVLVILAVISLIATPIVITMVKQSEEAANKRSVDGYGKAIENAIAQKLLETGNYPTSIDELEIEYSGKEVSCETKKLKEDYTVYLTKCRVGGKEVKDSSTEDGWYHYGNNRQSYKVGDTITYKGELYYTIEESGEKQDYVTLLKAEPLTYDEVNTYGQGEINRYYPGLTPGEAYYYNGYGGVAYYNRETCGYSNGSLNDDSCNNNYNESDIKKVVDRWAIDKLTERDLKSINGYKARLITIEELKNNLGYDRATDHGGYYGLNSEYTPNWVYNNNYWYWTMSSYEYLVSRAWAVSNIGYLFRGNVSSSDGAVRPVINLLKSSI